jgi:GNAT superfamily N-acetyltransferase
MIREMTTADVSAAMRLKDAAGWNQTAGDWQNLLAIEPRGCWVEEIDEAGTRTTVGSTTLVCYGRDLGWIGMVLVLPEFRGRGIARRLMEHALGFAEERQLRCLVLDATDMGWPLYRDLGFEDEAPIERWGLEVPPADRPAEGPPETEVLPTGGVNPEQLGRAEQLGRIVELDRLAFGADRGRVIEQIVRCCGPDVWAASEGYLLSRPGSKARFLGPCVAKEARLARGMILALLRRHRGETVYWDLLPANAPARELAESLGFRCARKLVRMSRPLSARQGTPQRIDWQFATAGFEYG